MTDVEKTAFLLRFMSPKSLSELLKSMQLYEIFELIKNQGNTQTPEEVKPQLHTVEKKVDGIKTDVISNVSANYLDIMRFDGYFSIIKYNTLKGLPEKHKIGEKSQWTDADDAAARTYIETNYGISNRPKYEDAFAEFQHEREYCPIKDKINSLVWDGEKRVENFLCKWLGADDTPYNRECSRLLFAGGINRAYRAGCKFDSVIVLIGSQGGGKSSVCRWLALDDELYSSIKTISGQKGYEGIQGKWIVEIEELLATLANDYGGMRSEETAKAFISTSTDFYRLPYAKRPTENPRSCIFIGTTNRTQFLTDKTGNRRWFPVTTNSDGRYLYEHEEECKEYISQCWAEMKHYYDTNDVLAKPVETAELLSEIKSKQAEAEHEDWREGVIEEYLQHKDRTCVIDVWQNALDNQFSKPTRKDSNEIVSILEKIGWKKGYAEKFNGYGNQMAFHNEKLRKQRENELNEVIETLNEFGKTQANS